MGARILCGRNLQPMSTGFRREARGASRTQGRKVLAHRRNVVLSVPRRASSQLRVQVGSWLKPSQAVSSMLTPAGGPGAVRSAWAPVSHLPARRRPHPDPPDRWNRESPRCSEGPMVYIIFSFGCLTAWVPWNLVAPVSHWSSGSEFRLGN